MPPLAVACPACRTWFEASGGRARCPACGARFSTESARLDRPAPTNQSESLSDARHPASPSWNEADDQMGPVLPPEDELAREEMMERSLPYGPAEVSAPDSAPAYEPAYSGDESPGNATPEPGRQLVNLSTLIGLAVFALFIFGGRFLSGELVAVLVVILIAVQWLTRRDSPAEGKSPGPPQDP